MIDFFSSPSTRNIHGIPEQVIKKPSLNLTDQQKQVMLRNGFQQISNINLHKNVITGKKDEIISCPYCNARGWGSNPRHVTACARYSKYFKRINGGFKCLSCDFKVSQTKIKAAKDRRGRILAHIRSKHLVKEDLQESDITEIPIIPESQKEPIEIQGKILLRDEYNCKTKQSWG